MKSKNVISSNEVIDRMLELARAVPEAVEGLPPECQTRAYWKGLFGRNERTRRLLEIYRELPAFTNQAPAAGGARAWRELMLRDYAGQPSTPPKQAVAILKQLVSSAKPLPPVPKHVKRWRDRFGPDEVIQRVRPAESDEYIPNPHRGTTTFQRFQGDPTYPSWITSDTHGPVKFDVDAPVKDNEKYIPRTTLSYCRWPWRWLEPKKGKYNWKLVDLALQTAHSRGQTLQVRFQPYTAPIDYSVEPIKARRHPPKVSVNVPDWYWDTGAKWTNGGKYVPNEPDSNDPRYLKHFGEFIRAFARRYDGRPDLESVDMAYAGFWGESGGNSTPAIARKLTDIYLKSFHKTQLVSMLGTPGCAYAAKKTRGTNRHIGWRADCIGDLRKKYGAGVPPELCWNHTFDSYPASIALCGVKEAWMAAAVTMETCGNVATWYMSDYDFDTIIREGYRYHMSVFMPKNVFYPQAILDKMVEFDKKIGYRFVLRQLTLPLECQSSQRIKLKFFLDNVGCAPIYRPYRLAVRFRQGTRRKIVCLKEDIRTWMPGHAYFEESIVVPPGLAKGEAKIDLAIVDDREQPKVWLAIQGEKIDGWHALISMDVV